MRSILLVSLTYLYVNNCCAPSNYTPYNRARTHAQALYFNILSISYLGFQFSILWDCENRTLLNCSNWKVNILI